MVKAFQLLLHLYPASYRAAFGREMSQVFAQRAADRPSSALFLVCEASGLLLGAARAWFSDLRPVLPALDSQTELPDEVSVAQQRVDDTIRRMVDAIATHQFQKARFYSHQEQQERQLLNYLRSQQR